MLEIAGEADGLLDEPLVLRVRGAGDQPVTWRARLRDDDGRVWRSEADRPEDLIAAWRPAKPAPGLVAALRSLHPVQIDVRVDAQDGRGANRTVTRRLLGKGVRVRRWREGAAGTLYLPPGGPATTLVLDATRSDDEMGVALLAGALLASRGARVLAVGPARGRAPAPDVGAAAQRLAELLELDAEAVVTLPVRAPGEDGEGVGLPPGVGVCGLDDAPQRAAAWQDLLARIGLASGS